MIRTPIGRTFAPLPTSFLYPLRNASTGKSRPKAASALRTAKPSSSIRDQARISLQNQGISSKRLRNDQSWTIEPKLGYWQARVKTPVSMGVILTVVALAAFSVIGTALSTPNPDIPPPPTSSSESTTQKDGTPQPENAQKSIWSLLASPITFIYRPVFVSAEAREEARGTWLFWASQGAAYAAFALVGIAFFFTPRYTRALTISSASLHPSKGGMLRFTPAWGRAVTCPLGDTILVSPVVPRESAAAGAGKSKRESNVLRTVSIEGNTLRGALLGWGLPMLRDGALVNGKEVSAGELTRLLERIWVQRGGELAVDGVKRWTVRGLFSRNASTS